MKKQINNQQNGQPNNQQSQHPPQILPQNLQQLNNQKPAKQGSAPLGCFLVTIGIIGWTVGAGLSVTMVGALIGIPIIVICTPILLYGGALFGRAFRNN